MTYYVGYCHLHCSQHGKDCKGDHESPITKNKVGSKLKKGQKFARVSTTGSASTGSHLHATLSTTVKGVFGITAQKQDLYKAIKANGWLMPFPDSSITGHYGTLSAYRKSKGMQPHSGTDWAQKDGTLIPSITDGEIVLIQWSKILGWVIVVKVEEATEKPKTEPKPIVKNNVAKEIICPNCGVHYVESK